MGIDITPTFVLNDKKKVLGLPDNFTAIVCEQLATTSVTLAEISASGSLAEISASGSVAWMGGEGMGQGSYWEDLVVTGCAVGFTTLLVAGVAAVVMKKRRGDGGSETRGLLESASRI